LPPIEKLRRLAELGIQLSPVEGFDRHFVFTRDGFVALVERAADDFGGIGAPGLFTGQGTLAMLLWRGDQPWFLAKGWQRRATPEEVDRLRRFAEDLKNALSG